MGCNRLSCRAVNYAHLRGRACTRDGRFGNLIQLLAPLVRLMELTCWSTAQNGTNFAAAVCRERVLLVCSIIV